jgi:hypothetical protein
MKLNLVEVTGQILSFIGLLWSFRSPDDRTVEECPEQEGIARCASSSDRDAVLDARACLHVGAMMIDFSPELPAVDAVQAPWSRRARGAPRIVASVG